MSASAGGRFRPDLEGLRGVAILLVVLFHAGVSVFSGGFVAVDVFFVLSGYFITGVLARELVAEGKVDVTRFLSGRALRLLPALIYVVVATLFLVMWLYAPIDRAPIAGTARSVALYAGNVQFANNNIDYFSSGENPFLHTWSLAVEEQFYLVWPFLFVLVAFMAQRSRETETEAEGGGGDNTALTRRRLLTGIITAGILSLAASLWLTKTAQPTAFFGMTTRVWEFALGGVLALLMTESAEDRSGLGTVLQIGGIAALAYAVWFFDRGTPYPGVAALVPALAAVALLLGGQFAPESAVSRVLSVEWLRTLGRLSYAWYLWHWPLVGVGHVLTPELGVFGGLAWSAVALGPAWWTYHFVELPWRNGAASKMTPDLIGPAALGISISMAITAHTAMRMSTAQASALPQKVFASARVDRMQHGCWAETVDVPVGACEFGDVNSNTVIALFGDSHAEHWLGGLDRAGKANGWKFVAMVKGGCPVPTMTAAQSGRIERWYRECARYREATIQRIVAMRPTAVLLSNWDHYLPIDGKGDAWQVKESTWRQGLRRTYERFTSAGITTIAMRGTPKTWFDVPACLSRQAARLPFARECKYDRSRAYVRAGIEAQNSAARGLPIRFVDMNDQICAGPRCSVMRNGIVMFTDDNHLTRTFSSSLAPVLGARLAPLIRRRPSS
jgi:peptidoglycan/LPS O-acetylase OafA/YrhL